MGRILLLLFNILLLCNKVTFKTLMEVQRWGLEEVESIFKKSLEINCVYLLKMCSSSVSCSMKLSNKSVKHF